MADPTQVAEAAALMNLDDNARFLVDGVETTWGEYKQSFVPRADYTRQRQADTQSVRDQVAQYQQNVNQQAQAYQQRLQQHYAQQAQRAQQQAVQQDQFEAARQQGYVTADHLDPLVAGVDQRLQQMEARNQEIIGALGLMHQQSQRAAQRYDPLITASATQRLDSTIEAAAQRLKVGSGAREHFDNHARDLYSAYEGDDLDAAYPDMLDESWTSAKAAFASANKAEVQAARRGLSSSGGIASPSKALDEDLEPADFWTEDTDEEEI